MAFALLKLLGYFGRAGGRGWVVWSPGFVWPEVYAIFGGPIHQKEAACRKIVQCKCGILQLKLY